MESSNEILTTMVGPTGSTKVGIPIILLRNISPAQGLANDTRLVVTPSSCSIIQAKILTGMYVSKVVCIPRVNMDTDPSPTINIRSGFPGDEYTHLHHNIHSHLTSTDVSPVLTLFTLPVTTSLTTATSLTTGTPLEHTPAKVLAFQLLSFRSPLTHLKTEHRKCNKEDQNYGIAFSTHVLPVLIESFDAF